MLTIFILFLCMFCFCVLSVQEDLYAKSYTASVEDISNRRYFQAVFDLVQNAKKSITAAMYIISLSPEKDDEVKRLLDGLVSARERGVKVKVIFEYHSGEDFTPKGLNYNAYNFLGSNGIEVYFDRSSSNCMHAKTIVIDEEVVITGSSNWSVPAFRSSYETDVIIRSRSLAQDILKEISEIPVRRDESCDKKDRIPIPLSFCLSSSGILKKIVSANDERALDMLILLLGNEKRTISIDYIAQTLFLAGKMDRLSYRRQIIKVLKKLDERYGVLKYTAGYDEDAADVQLNLPSCSETIDLPRMYFACGWNNVLSLSGKGVLITMYAEYKELSSMKNQGDYATRDVITSLPIAYLSKKYGFKGFTYSKGIQELKRYNIIKVYYSEGYSDRAPTRINILGLYDINEYNIEIEELENIYGRDFIRKVRELAGIVFCAYDITILKDIIKKIDYCGMEKVREAFICVGKKRPDNFKRTYNYVLGILSNTTAVRGFSGQAEGADNGDI